MATCPTIQELEAYFDGELNAARAAEIRAHLVACAACAAELSRLEQTSQLFRAAPAPRLSQIAIHRLHANLSKTIEQERDKDLVLRRIARACSAVAACVVLAGTMFLTTRQAANRSTVSTALAAPPWTDVAVDASETPSTAAAQNPGGIALAEYYLASASTRAGDEVPN